MCLKCHAILLISMLFVSMEKTMQTAVNENERTLIDFVIMSQANSYHNNLADLKRTDLLKQASELHGVSIRVLKSHMDFGHLPGHWTVFPIFKQLSVYSKSDWVFFLEDRTYLNLPAVLNVLSSYGALDDLFVGHALNDSEPTIIHHFSSKKDLYPDFSAGFFMSLNLIKKLTRPCEDCQFAIDPKSELAKFVRESAGIKLTHEPRLCLEKTSDACASWIGVDLPDCGLPFPSRDIYVGVKTCKKFHKDRVPVVKKTWAPDVENLLFFSDVIDPDIPTQQVVVANVEVGHCKKTLDILKHYVAMNFPFKWLIIVDDDTLLSFRRLQRLLSCYNSSEDVALGERYGYQVQAKYGYDYPTGGSGMVFSHSMVRKLASNCVCPSISSPDDMILGVCLKNLDIPVTHSPHFHQARPVDYSAEFLSPLKHISFHKHWMIDPVEVYHEWLSDNPPPTTPRAEL